MYPQLRCPDGWTNTFRRSDLRRRPNSREADAVSVRIEHKKRRCAPGFFPQRLSKVDTSSSVLREKTLDVIDLNKGRQQAILSFANAGSEDRLVDEPEVESGGASTHGAVERRIAVQEIDRKAELVAKESSRGFDIRNEHHRQGSVKHRGCTKLTTPPVDGCRRALPFRRCTHRCALLCTSQ
jgi:hypothetical protein